MQVDAINAGPAEVIGNPGGINPFRQCFQAVEIIPVQRIDGADGERHAVHHHRIAFTHPVQVDQRASTSAHIILRDDLEPVDARVWRIVGALQQVCIMLRAEAKAESEIGAAAFRLCGLLCHGLDIGNSDPENNTAGPVSRPGRINQA